MYIKGKGIISILFLAGLTGGLMSTTSNLKLKLVIVACMLVVIYLGDRFLIINSISTSCDRLEIVRGIRKRKIRFDSISSVNLGEDNVVFVLKDGKEINIKFKSIQKDSVNYLKIEADRISKTVTV